ncbi:MAG: hypothetical protein MJZ30_12775 [Paludibacteraceae bacterium]|nr:hypothetical protein [Paludibacteraceae bacterium]
MLVRNHHTNLIRMLLSFLLLLLCYPSHAITWEERGGEAIRLGTVTATTAIPSGTYYAVTCNGVIAKNRDGGYDINTYQFLSARYVGIFGVIL